MRGNDKVSMWLTIAIGAYLINAGVYVADKFLLSKKIHSSITYAFYVGIWSIFNLCLLVFDFWLPIWQELILDLSAGALFVATLVFWYKALHQSEATRVVPIVGALVPIFSLTLSFFFLGENLSQRQLLAFAVLICGGVLISIKYTRFYSAKRVIAKMRYISGLILGEVHAKSRPTWRLITNSLISAFFFAAYYVLIKYIYLNQPFIGSFVWSRVGSFLGVLLFLFIPVWRERIVHHQKGVKTPKNMFFFLSVRLLAALAFIMLNWAISLGSVAMVNALQGVQYLFLFLIILVISTKFPRVLKEEIGGGVILQKIIGILFVGLGLYMLI